MLAYAFYKPYEHYDSVHPTFIIGYSIVYVYAPASIVFRPGLVHELLTLDESLEMNNLEDITDVEEGFLFNR